jgi:hypothetical protein
MAEDNKKKSLSKKKKNVTSTSVLVQLYHNRKLVTKVDNMLDEGKPYDYIMEFCKENGLDISKASITNYKKKREEAISTGKDLLPLLDKRAKSNVTHISDKKRTPIDMTAEHNKVKGDGDGGEPPERTLYSDLEFLEEVIAKGRKGLQYFEVVDTPLAMKAVEMKAKITNNELRGLSLAGLREIRLRQAAREAALQEVMEEYIPEDKVEEALDRMVEAEEEFFRNLDLTEEDRRITQALRDAGIDL